MFHVLLKPCNSDWDLNACGRDLNLAKTLFGTPTHGLLIRVTHLVSGLTEAQVLYISALKEFSERQSDRQEVDLLI